MGLKEGEEGLGEGGGGEEVVASVGLDLTNDVEAHSRHRPVTPRIAGQASKHHHAHYQNDQQVFGLSGKGWLTWIY